MSHLLCFGEVLWDLLPRGRFLGGAPLNVAYHLAQLGLQPTLASTVGRDALGDEALASIAAAGVDVAAVKQHPTLPTGTASVRLDARGQATFHLPQPVAWDEITIECPVAPDVIVFGTLALRSAANRAALMRLFDTFPAARVVCDLNLRPPFDDLAPLAPLLARLSLLKLNGDEARRLANRPADASDWAAISSELKQHYNGALICITLGGDGAGLRVGEAWHHVAAQPVVVRDTVGAGDAFTAALIAGWLRDPDRTDWPRVLRAACALGSFVASKDGAQPAYGAFKLPE